MVTSALTWCADDRLMSVREKQNSLFWEFSGFSLDDREDAIASTARSIDDYDRGASQASSTMCRSGLSRFATEPYAMRQRESAKVGLPSEALVVTGVVHLRGGYVQRRYGGLPTVALAITSRPTFALRATVGNLRVGPRERRLDTLRLDS